MTKDGGTDDKQCVFTIVDKIEMNNIIQNMERQDFFYLNAYCKEIILLKFHYSRFESCIETCVFLVL